MQNKAKQSKTKQNKAKQSKTKQTLILNDTFSLCNNKRGDKYSDMQCPKCSTQMQLMQRYEAFIDYCPSCKGVWLAMQSDLVLTS